MTDSSSFTSLHELVQSHLSKLNVQETQSESSINQVAVTKHELTTKAMDTGIFTPGQLLNPPGRLFPSMISSTSNSDAVSVLAQQVANMFKAKELKKLEEVEEKKFSEEKMTPSQCDDYVIDFSSAIIDPSVPQWKYTKGKNCYKDCESIVNKGLKKEPISKVEKIELRHDNKIDEDLPWPIDLHHLLTTKLKRGKCSPFGKVVCARYTNNVLPYPYKNYPSNIVRFNFSTLSPDEVAMNNAKKINKKVDFCTDFGLQKSQMLMEREKVNGYKSQRGICMH